MYEQDLFQVVKKKIYFTDALYIQVSYFNASAFEINDQAIGSSKKWTISACARGLGPPTISLLEIGNNRHAIAIDFALP